MMVKSSGSCLDGGFVYFSLCIIAHKPFKTGFSHGGCRVLFSILVLRVCRYTVAIGSSLQENELATATTEESVGFKA